MSGFPWRAAICIGAAALVTPLLAGAVAMSGLDWWLMDVVFWWFFAAPTQAYELGVPTADSDVAVVIVYALQYVFVWWAVDTARAVLWPARAITNSTT